MSDLLKFARTMATNSSSLTESVVSTGVVIDASMTLESLRESYEDILGVYESLIEGAAKAPEVSSHTVNDKTEKFLKDAHQFIEEASEDRNKKFNAGQCKLLISIGIGLINMAAFGAAGSIGLILLVGQLIFLFIGLAEQHEGLKKADEVNAFEKKLDAVMAKTKDKKTKDEIEKLILKIQAKKKMKGLMFAGDDKKKDEKK